MPPNSRDPMGNLRVVWQPATGGDPRMDEVFARLTALRAAVQELTKHLEWLEATAWQVQKEVEGDRKVK